MTYDPHVVEVKRKPIANNVSWFWDFRRKTTKLMSFHSFCPQDYSENLQSCTTPFVEKSCTLWPINIKFMRYLAKYSTFITKIANLLHISWDIWPNSWNILTKFTRFFIDAYYETQWNLPLFYEFMPGAPKIGCENCEKVVTKFETFFIEAYYQTQWKILLNWGSNLIRNSSRVRGGIATPMPLWEVWCKAMLRGVKYMWSLYYEAIVGGVRSTPPTLPYMCTPMPPRTREEFLIKLWPNMG